MAYLNRKTFHIIKYGDRRIKKLWDDNFHVDDLIAPTIQILNRKGYSTAGCCAGEHELPIDGIWHHSKVFGKCWILFKKGVSLPSLPPGFNIESLPQGFDGFSKESFEYKDLSSSVYITKVCDTQHDKVLNQLYEWALGLPKFTT